MGDIVLSGSVRENLLALQRTTDLMGQTQNRLATGKKVNSALDNPASFFTANGLQNRADDLATLLDSIGQAVQTIKAANDGVSSITKLIEAAKAKANQASVQTDTFSRADYVKEYNTLLSQIQELAEDASYNGKNLLGGPGNELTVYFNEDNSNYLTINTLNLVDVSASLGLDDLTEASLGSTTLALTDGTNPLTLASKLVDDTTQFDTTGNTLTFTDGNSVSLGTITVTPTMTVGELISQINSNFTNIRASFQNGSLTIESTEDITITGGKTGGGLDSAALTATSSSWQTGGGIDATLTKLNDALTLLHNQAAGLGTNLTVVQNRQNFTKSFISTLTQGSDMLTAADTNEEGANLLALQTRQQLSTTALSLATQADQGVLRLFQ